MREPLVLNRVLLAAPRGFCAGVVMAYDIVDRALRVEKHGPVYVLHEIVHNRHVVEALAAKGAIFVEALDQVPEGARLIFSAHGVPPAVRSRAAARELRIWDATCPLVTKVHLQARRYARAEYTVLLVGHEEHVEVIGTRGEAPERTSVIGSVAEAEAVQVADPERVVVVTQTTLSADDTADIIATLRRRFPRAQIRNDICFATQNRQAAVKRLAAEAQLVLVIGSHSSSNSNRLVEVAIAAGAQAHLVDRISQLQPEWLAGVECVGITAGASTPEWLVEEAVAHLRALGAEQVDEVQVASEEMVFSLPEELQDRTLQPLPA